MELLTRPSTKARKTPVQARSTETRESIFEATVQVLLRFGLERLTTTRVAERAGVSVGTLYQYFPNKQALLFALLERHLHSVAEAVEQASARLRGRPLEAMINGLVTAFVDAKLRHADVSWALYRIGAELNTTTLSLQMQGRLRAAVAGLLVTAPDAKAANPEIKANLLCAAMAGAMRAYLEAGTNSLAEASLRRELVLLLSGYLRAESAGRDVPSPEA